MMRCLLLLLLAALAVASTSEPRLIHFGDSSEPINPRSSAESVSPEFAYAASGAVQRDALYLIQFAKYSEAAVSALAAELGFVLVGYVPEDTALVYCSESVALAAKARDAVTFVTIVTPDRKKYRSASISAQEAEHENAVRAANTPIERVALKLLGEKKGLDLSPVISLYVMFPNAQLADVGTTAIRAMQGVSRAASIRGGKVAVAVERSDLDRVVNAVAAIPSVVGVERMFPKQVNNRYARVTLQMGEAYGDDMKEPFLDGGFDGSDVTVAVADSGVDYQRCAFYDEEHVQVVRSPKQLAASGHRKIQGYWAHMDQYDYLGGHGTHVCGSVLGNVDAGKAGDKGAYLATFKGMAPGSKLLFTDVGCQTSGGCVTEDPDYMPFICSGRCEKSDAAVYVPDDLGTHLFPFAYQNGARIHSNSWGGSYKNYYSSHSLEIDEFVHKHPDFLVLFAAGNSGTDGSRTVGTEAQAKNALTVGASVNTVWGARNSVYYVDLDSNRKMLNDALDGSGYELKSNDECCPDKFCKGSRSFLCILYPSLKPSVAGLCCQEEIAKIRSKYTEYNLENLADFSSRGPASDSRIKPDVVAPGQFIVSVKGKGGTGVTAQACGEPEKGAYNNVLTEMSGTSMATPLVAGMTAVIRQYFESGSFPVGAAEKIPLKPSAALVKAIVINAAVPLRGKIADSTTTLHHQVMPNNYEGHGRPQLDQAIPLPERDGDEATSLLLAADHSAKATYADPSVSDGSSFHRCFTVAQETPLRVSLVYTDKPAYASASKALVNDLDLWMTKKDATDIWAGNNQRSFDNLNNVEKIVIPNATPGTYIVGVRGNKVIDDEQSFALVINGKRLTAASCSDDLVAQGDKMAQRVSAGAEATVVDHWVKEYDPVNPPAEKYPYKSPFDHDGFKWPDWLIPVGIGAAFFLVVVCIVMVICCVAYCKLGGNNKPRMMYTGGQGGNSALPYSSNAGYAALNDGPQVPRGYPQTATYQPVHQTAANTGTYQPVHQSAADTGTLAQ